MALKQKSRYELKEIIGRGGMGVVYKAYDRAMKRYVALKTLLDFTDSYALQLFEKECEGLASLIHPNIIEIFDSGQMEEEGTNKPFLVMPLLPGLTLEQLIRSSSSRLTLQRCLDMFCQTCRGLQAAHERGIIHRDLKPSNIFVMDDDSVKIIDFGVAHRVAHSNSVGRKGTPFYMAPEQISGKALTPASDIFSAAVTFYEALTHRRPFDRASESEVEEAVLQVVPPPVHDFNPEVPLPLSQAIHKAMAKNPLHRFRSAREFSDVLQKAFRGEPIEIFNSERIRPRLVQARELLEKGDNDFAAEIVAELKSEGHLDKGIEELSQRIEQSVVQRRVAQLLQTARSRLDEREYQIAYQKAAEALQLEPRNTDALALQARIEAKQTDADVDKWLSIARTHADNKAFGPAREAIQRLLERRPREPRATQLLGEIDRMEQAYKRSREEKERLYSAAMEAERNGDISSALSRIARVIELDKTIPDTARTAFYQRAYDRIRSEHDSVKNAWNEAKRLSEAGRFPEALAVCNENLASNPHDTAFKALKVDIEEKQRQQMSARIAEIDRRVESEPDLERRVNILEEAVRENPGEAHFERALQNARDKLDTVSTIVARARSCEDHAQFSEALAQWEILQRIYPRFPGLSVELDRVTRKRDKSRRNEAHDRWVEQIEQALEGADSQRALDLCHMAQQEFPADQELVQLERMARQQLDRRGRAKELVDSGKAACERGDLAAGLPLLREGFQLDTSNEQARHLLAENLVEQGRLLINSDPERAREYFRETFEIDPTHPLATNLVRLLDDQGKEQVYERAIAEIRTMEAEEHFREALEATSEAIKRYGKDNRLQRLEDNLRRKLDTSRKRHLGQMLELERQIDSSHHLDPERRQQYVRTVDNYLTNFKDDEEFKMVGENLRRRLQTVAVEEEPPGSLPEIEPQEETPDEPRREGNGHSNYSTPADRAPKPPSNWRGYLVAAAVVLVLGAAFCGVKLLSPKIPGRKPLTPVPMVTRPIKCLQEGTELFLNGSLLGTCSPLYTATKQDQSSLTVEARKPGYRSAKQQIDFTRNLDRQPIPISLVPEDPVFRIVGSGSVSVDDNQPVEVKDGQPQLTLRPGDHTVRVQMNRSSQISFKVHVEANGLPALSAISAREIAPLLVSNFGTATKLYGSAATPIPVRKDGELIGNLTSSGLELTTPAIGATTITTGDGKDLKTRSVESGPGRSLTAQLEADPSLGTLIVNVNEEGATVSLLVRDKEYRRAQVVNGKAVFPNIRARSYAVQCIKDQFEPAPAQTAVVTKGETQTLSLSIQKATKPAVASSLVIQSAAGILVRIDGGAPITAPPDGRIVRSEISPGSHKIEASNGARYLPWSGSVAVNSGEKADVQIPRLQLAPGGVVVAKRPAESTVVYRKAGENTSQKVSENRITLPEGQYTFIGSAPGYEDDTAEVTVRAGEYRAVELTLPRKTNAWPEGAWTLVDSWYLHKGNILSGPQVPADIQFQALLSDAGFMLGKKHRLVFVTDYLNAENHIQFELTDGHVTGFVVQEGHRTKVIDKDVPKVSAYFVRIESHSDHIALRIGGENVGVISQSDLAGLSGGRFGFIGNKEVRMVNFEWKRP